LRFDKSSSSERTPSTILLGQPSSPKYHKQILSTRDSEALEDVLETACGGDLQIIHRLELRRLAISLCYGADQKRHGEEAKNHTEPLKALKKFRANLQRRKKNSDPLTSSRLMEIPEPARALLLHGIALIFRNEIDDYTQIDFDNVRHVDLLTLAVANSIEKVTDNQGRPKNAVLDEFFVGLKKLYEVATGQPAIAGAHFNDEPKTDFEKLMYLGYQIIRPAQAYPAALKAYDRAISRNS